MSDKLLERIAVALEAMLVVAQGGKTPAVSTTAATTTATKAANKNADKTSTTATSGAKGNGAAAPNKAANKAAATETKAAKPKTPQGRYTPDQVKDKMREVLNTAGLGRQSVIDILDEEANGAKNFGDAKAEDYDKLYEAFENALHSGEGGEPGAAGSAEDELGV